MRLLVLAPLLVVACSAAEAPPPAPPATCSAPDAGADVSTLPDARREPAVCVSEIGGADGGGVVATCDAPGAFSWVDVASLVFDCRGAPCPRGARCLVNGRLEWPGVCR